MFFSYYISHALRIILLFSLTVICLNVSAKDLSEAALLTQIPIVTSATLMAQTLLETPSSVTIIDKETIEASGAQHLVDILRLVPGFQAFHINSNVFGTSYHSVNDQFPNHLEIMIDGRSVYTPLLSTVHWNSIGLLPTDIERVEVIRGSNTATLGSNAFLGSINFITRHPAMMGKAEISTTFGSLNTRQVHAKFSEQNRGFFYSLSGFYTENTGNKRFNDGSRRNALNARIEFSPNLHTQISYRVGIDTGFNDIGYLYPYHAFPENERYITQQDYRTFYQQLRWSSTISPALTLHFDHAYQNLKLKEHTPDPYTLLKFSNMNTLKDAQDFLALNPNYKGYREDGVAQTLSTLLGFEYTPITHFRTYTGLQHRYEKTVSPALLQQERIHANSIRLFNNSVLTLTPKLNLNLGLSYEQRDTDDQAESTRLGINYSFKDNTLGRIGFSRSKRLPSILEQSVNFGINTQFGYIPLEVSNTSLNSEQINSWEVGILHAFTPLNAYLDNRLFYERVTQGIATRKTQDDFQPGKKENNAAWANMGIETQFKWEVNDTLNLLMNYTYIDNKTSEWSQGIYENFPSQRLTPKHSTSILIHWKPWDNWNFSVGHYQVSSAKWRKTYGTLKEQPSYTRNDLRLARRWSSLKQSEVEISLTLQNVLGKTYQEFYQDHHFGRRVFLQMKYSLD
ncbi:TonB-dependent receptor plug domain-containing protein [Nitrincola alkalisediminis]|nr:TonB-dependent receptor plug domain-containing protein [Nitrincola alkalisediminis]